jgi:hypothetical protein
VIQVFRILTLIFLITIIFVDLISFSDLAESSFVKELLERHGDHHEVTLSEGTGAHLVSQVSDALEGLLNDFLVLFVS